MEFQKNPDRIYCHILGIGHSDAKKNGDFCIISQLDFIKSLPEEKQLEICKKGKVIEEIAEEWNRMISPNRTYFKGNTAELGMIAVRSCFEYVWSENLGSDFDPGEIDAIIAATNTGTGYPSLADAIKLGIDIKQHKALCFDVTEACVSGSVAIQVARSLIESGKYKNVLVVCSEKATTLAPQENWQGSNLFGDASFAILLTASKNPEDESFIFSSFNSIPYDGKFELIQKTENGFIQNGGKVHGFVMGSVPKMVADAAKVVGDISCYQHAVFHQPSAKTLGSLEEELRRLGFCGIFHRSVDIGNASSASFGNLLSKLVHEGKIKPGEAVLTCTFGAGLSIGIIGLKF